MLVGTVMNMWTRMGGIGGAFQERAALQERGIGASRTVYRRQAPASKPVAFNVPADLAARLAAMPGELYDIYPGQPDTTTSSALSIVAANTQGATVHTFTPPTGTFIILDPHDLTQEVLFQPFTSAGTASSNYIPGLIEIYAQTGLRGRTEKVYAGITEHHRTDSNLASVGNQRRWRLGYLIKPGEKLLTQFNSQGTGASASIGTGQTTLDHKVLAKGVLP